MLMENQLYKLGNVTEKLIINWTYWTIVAAAPKTKKRERHTHRERERERLAEGRESEVKTWANG